MKPLCLIVIAVALFSSGLAACTASGPSMYSAADKSGFGYHETRIESDRYQITYRGSAGMQPDVVNKYALRRAAELCLTDGYDWFRVASRNISTDRRGGVNLGVGVGTSSYGRHTGVGVGVGGDLGRVGAHDYVTVAIEILMGHGKAPEGSDVYVASAVLQSMGATH